MARDGVAATYRLTAANTLPIVPRVEDSEGIDLLGHKVLAHQRGRVKCAVVAGLWLRNHAPARDAKEFKEALRPLTLGEEEDTFILRWVRLASLPRCLRRLLVL